MITPTKPLILLCALACEAAYELDPDARAKELAAAGLTQIAYLQGTNDARALFCRRQDDPSSDIILAFQGTQFTRGELASIFANFEVSPVNLGAGRDVEAGYLGQVQSLLADLAVQPRPQIITGHSMGGTMAELYANMDGVGPAVLVSFGAPKCANNAYWVAARNAPLRIVNERDAAPAWPPWEAYCQPGDAWWLHREVAAASLTEMRDIPVPRDSVGDHAIEAYIANIEALPVDIKETEVGLLAAA